jgi:hypothetical protein
MYVFHSWLSFLSIEGLVSAGQKLRAAEAGLYEIYEMARPDRPRDCLLRVSRNLQHGAYHHGRAMRAQRPGICTPIPSAPTLD